MAIYTSIEDVGTVPVEEQLEGTAEQITQIIPVGNNNEPEKNIHEINTLSEILGKVTEAKVERTEEEKLISGFFEQILDTKNKTPDEYYRLGLGCVADLCAIGEKKNEGTIGKLEAKELSKRVLKTFFGTDKLGKFEQEFLAYTSVAIALAGECFDIVISNVQETRNGVNIWANPKNKDYTLAIQVVIVDDPENLKNIEATRADLVAQNPRSVVREFADNADTMVKYVNQRKKFGERTIIPVLLVLPGGENNPFSSYNFITGEPSKEARAQIQNKINRF